MWLYFLVFFFAFLVDILPFPGPPAWMVMVYFQMRYGLDIWNVLFLGVIGSTLGRYTMSRYFRRISNMLISPLKNKDLEFLGSKLSNKRWRSWIFVFFYTLVPLPTTPLFNVVGIARVNALNVIPPFLAGKFISDAIMVTFGHMAANNIPELIRGIVTWQSAVIIIISLLILCGILFIDWWSLIVQKKLKFHFNIWKK
jgi:membrane protein DedA with SNARE-associated domain